MRFYEKGQVRIHYEETGSGFPLLLIAGGGLNATIPFFTGNAPFNATNSSTSTAASRWTCATPTAAEQHHRLGPRAGRPPARHHDGGPVTAAR
jgi:hypothetical protein